MSLLEIIGEYFNPGPVGEIKINREPNSPKKKYAWLHFLISAILLLTIEYSYIRMHNQQLIGEDFLIFNGIFIIYLIVSYYINISPNTNNVGWIPFIIDNPFRISDDINRLSIFIMVSLLPGKYLLGSFINYYLYLKNRTSN
jgi:hypothetical protein